MPVINVNELVSYTLRHLTEHINNSKSIMMLSIYHTDDHCNREYYKPIFQLVVTNNGRPCALHYESWLWLTIAIALFATN